MKERKMIAWGASKLLHLHLEHTAERFFSYCVDSYAKRAEVNGLRIVQADALAQEAKGAYHVVIFAVSNKALREISLFLSQMGLEYGTDFSYYSDFFRPKFDKKLAGVLDHQPEEGLYRFALAQTLNSVKPVHTTILGTQLFLECLKATENVDGDIAEVGAFEGGNSFIALNYLALRGGRARTYHIFDSFEGFPELSAFDPANCKQGDYCTQASLQSVLNDFRLLPGARIVPGFVPQTFDSLPKNAAFSLVFYDCDLYQPALDTFAYFWDRLDPGGILLVHDYCAEAGGFEGVHKATHEFFDPRGVPVHGFFETTMALVRK